MSQVRAGLPRVKGGAHVFAGDRMCAGPCCEVHHVACALIAACLARTLASALVFFPSGLGELGGLQRARKITAWLF